MGPKAEDSRDAPGTPSYRELTCDEEDDDDECEEERSTTLDDHPHLIVFGGARHGGGFFPTRRRWVASDAYYCRLLRDMTYVDEMGWRNGRIKKEDAAGATPP
ncbi:hypothetical protein BHM03_00052782 [Ensete ventricosum]|nr:hypothetical protein BHM03_00052782 [Ensete ventricosum]